MNKWIILLVVFSLNISNAQSIQDIRRLYLESSKNDSKLDSLNHLLEENKNKTNILSAYYGANLLLKSKHLKNPFKKLKFFEKGKDIIENAITKEPTNIEIALIRYSAQKNSPGFLMYNKNLIEDYEFITTNINSIKDKKLKKYISETIKNL
jgi:hypothetical protein|tara:strand:- start:60 stop:515 length:456 start_codon:yes stop_codon:yes gene_type:complete